MDGLDDLRRRIDQLDDEEGYPHAEVPAHLDLARFVTVMEQVTSAGTIRDVLRMPCVAAAEADALVERCRLLTRLRALAPEIVVGPVNLGAQFWIATGNPSHLPPGEPTLAEQYFIGMTDKANLRPSTKPFGVGMFTATGGLGTHGMWRLYLDLNRGSTLFPLPWHTWAVEPRRDVVIHEIAGATEWVEFARSFPLRDGTLLYPDWNAAARECDAVHMTTRAIAATQGLYFPTEDGIVAAPYWDVEQTFWLRWCFNAVKLVEVTAEDPE